MHVMALATTHVIDYTVHSATAMQTNGVKHEIFSFLIDTMKMD